MFLLCDILKKVKRKHCTEQEGETWNSLRLNQKSQVRNVKNHVENKQTNAAPPVQVLHGGRLKGFGIGEGPIC